MPRRAPVYPLIAELFVIALLGGWVYSEYLNNPFMQAYLQQVERTQGIWISLVTGLAGISFPLIFALTRERRKRFLALTVYGGVVIAFLSLWLYVEYQSNVYMRIYVAQNPIRVMEAFLGTGALIVALMGLTATGMTGRLATKLRISLIQRKTGIFVFTSYVLLTLGFTYPVVIHMSDAVPQISRDIWHVLWDLWWVKTSITSFQSPFHPNIILYPTGTNAAFHTFAFAASLPGVLLQELFGLVVTFNLLFLSSYILSGMTMYALTKYLTKDVEASFIAGVIFAFFPDHVLQSLSHLNIMTQQWLPLYALFLIKMFREPRLRNGIYAGLALSLVTLSDLHFLYMALVFSFLLLLYVLLRARNLVLNRGLLARLCLLTATLGLLVLPFFFDAISLALSGKASFSQEPLSNVTHVSADLAAYFVPGQATVFFSTLTTQTRVPIIAFGSISNRYHYVGYTVLLLASFAILRSLKKGRRGFALFWALLASIAFIISLGPFLIFLGKNTGVPLPYSFVYLYLFQYFPFSLLRSFKALGRFDILLMLSFSILAAFSVKDIRGYIKRKQAVTRLDQFLAGRVPHLRVDRARLFSIVIVSLILFEYWFLPLPLGNSTIPAYYSIIKQDPGNFSVLEVPVLTAGQSYMYYQTYHGHSIVNGKVARTPPYSLIFLQTTPFIRTLGPGGVPRARGPLVQDVNDTEIAPYVLGEYGIKYVIVHSWIIDQAVIRGAVPFVRAGAVISLLDSVLGPPVYNGTEAAVFRFENSANLNLTTYLHLTGKNFLTVMEGDWLQLNSIGSTYEYPPRIRVFSANDTFVQLKMSVASTDTPRLLQVAVEGDPPTRYLIATGSNVTLVTSDLSLRGGQNLISFNSVQPCSVQSAALPICTAFTFQSIEILQNSLRMVERA